MFSQLEAALISTTKGSSLGAVLKTVDGYSKFDWWSLKNLGTVLPGVIFAIGAGKISPVAQKYQVEVRVLAYCLSQNLGRQGQARTKPTIGGYAIMQTVLELLTGQTLGIEISPLEPVSFEPVALSDDQEKLGISAHLVEFNTGWTIQALAEGDPTYLETIGLNYYLKPGDDVSDASDTIVLGG